ncbi:MAG: ubiquinone biosynthesis protein COQ4, partial [Myxococcota bacterium]
TFHGMILDPGRLDLVLELTRSAASLLEPGNLPDELQAFADAGEETPLIELDALRSLPEGTLGRRFADHMDRQGFAPEDLEHALPEGELALVSQHLQRRHDVHHILTGFSTDIPGEIGLQAFYLANFRALPAQALIAAVMLRPLVVGGTDNDETEAVMDAIVAGWQQGRAASCLFGIDWSAHWSRPLEAVQADFNLRDPACGPTPASA